MTPRGLRERLNHHARMAAAVVRERGFERTPDQMIAYAESKIPLPFFDPDNESRRMKQAAQMLVVLCNDKERTDSMFKDIATVGHKVWQDWGDD